MDPPCLILVIAACIGSIALSRSLLRVSHWAWATFFRPAKDLKRYGSWAMVTGSADGIGKALAFELASHGLNLVLVDRQPAKLKATSDEIQRRHPRLELKSLLIDFAGCRGDEVCRAIGEGTKGLDLGILINNVGVSYPYARFLHEVGCGLAESVVRVNVVGTTLVTRTVISGMLERKMKKGLVVNIGSGSSTCSYSYPLYTVYAATKAYVAMLSRSLSLEYKQHGITVQCQIPLLVGTNMSFVEGTSLFVPYAETFSKASITWMGHQDQICVPYWPHAMQACLMAFLPDPLLNWHLFRYFLSLRAQGLSKDARVRS